MLVATAAVGLIAPLGAQATDVNFEGMKDYSRSKPSKNQKINSKTFSNELANTNARVDAVEAQLNNFEAGSFSDTTTLGGKAVFVIGAVDGNDTVSDSEAVTASYIYSMDLNTSFTGDDNLYVRLKTGDGWSASWSDKPSNYHIENKDQGDIMHVDKIWYTFPIGDSFTATVGPKIENYYMLGATPSVYKPGVLKAFKLGGHGVAFGASTSTGGGLTYKNDNGFSVSTTFNSKQAATATGLFTEGDQNKINTQVGYTKDNYHLSATYTMQNGWNSWSYYSTADLVDGVSATTASADGVALRGWWRPDETGTATPSISVGYDVVSISGTDVTEGSGYFVGLNWEDMFQPSDKIGFAVGQPMKATEAAAGQTLDEVDPFMWEAYYSFRPNDSIEITPGIFGTTDVKNDSEEDLFGAMVSTTFKF